MSWRAPSRRSRTLPTRRSCMKRRAQATYCGCTRICRTRRRSSGMHRRCGWNRGWRSCSTGTRSRTCRPSSCFAMKCSETGTSIRCVVSVTWSVARSLVVMTVAGDSVKTIIPVARPWMDEQEAAAARRAILSGWVTQGPEVAAFEQEFADAVGAAHACAVSSCTTALHLALLALGVGPGDEVVTVSHSFIATANAIRYCGASPVFVDVDPRTYNLDPARIEVAITPRTKAIMPVHQIGLPCDMEAILEV